MTTIDRRTRFAGAAMIMDAEQLFGDLGERLQETGTLAARGVELLELPPLTFEVDGTAAHLVVADGALTLREGRADDGPVIALDATACSELFQDVVSTFGLVMPGRVEVLRPRADQFVAWEPALRAAIDGRAVSSANSWCASRSSAGPANRVLQSIVVIVILLRARPQSSGRARRCRCARWRVRRLRGSWRSPSGRCAPSPGRLRR